MDKDKIKRIDDEEKKLRNLVVQKLAMTIESSFESFGVICRVVEYNFHPNDIEFCLELVLGTPLEKVLKYRKDIAMSISSPTGDVEIEAPIPGRSLFAVRVPLKRGWIKSQYEYQQKLDADTKKITEEAKLENKAFNSSESSWPGLRVIIAGIIYLIADLLKKLGTLIRGKKNA